MNEKNDGGYAFPQALNRQNDFVGCEGMSVRDYFAAKAMAATIQRLGPIVKVSGTGSLELLPDNPAVSEDDGRQIRAAIALLAYEYADAMLVERAKGGTS